MVNAVKLVVFVVFADIFESFLPGEISPSVEGSEFFFLEAHRFGIEIVDETEHESDRVSHFSVCRSTAFDDRISDPVVVAVVFACDPESEDFRTVFIDLDLRIDEVSFAL